MPKLIKLARQAPHLNQWFWNRRPPAVGPPIPLEALSLVSYVRGESPNRNNVNTLFDDDPKNWPPLVNLGRNFEGRNGPRMACEVPRRLPVDTIEKAPLMNRGQPTKVFENPYRQGLNQTHVLKIIQDLYGSGFR